MHIKKLEQAI